MLDRLETQKNGAINIRRLKDFASENLPNKSMLCHCILMEKDELTAEEYVSKLIVWLKILEKENFK